MGTSMLHMLGSNLCNFVVVFIFHVCFCFLAQAGGSVPGTAASAPGAAAGGGGGSASTTGGQQDYSAAWAEYYRQQAAYYGQTGQQPPGQPANPQQGQVGAAASSRSCFCVC